MDKELSQEDRERLREVLATFGDLQADGRYTGSERAGYTEPPGAALSFGKLRDPLPLSELLKTELWQYKIAFNQVYDQSPTTMQAVGGMDEIPKAFAKRLGRMIRYDSVVDEIRKTAAGARVICHDSRGKKTSIESDFIICTMPLSVLRNVPNGILVGAYSFGVFPESQVSVSERLNSAIISGERMHPGYRRMVRDGISVAWPNVKYSQGGWASWTNEQKASVYRTLQEPDGAIYFAGEHLSNLPAWQEGAILSAHHAIAKIAARVHS